jgi:spoIIIJ-associated protein
MARDTEKRAATVEEAVDAALAELGVTEQDARIEVLQEPKSELGADQEAVVRVIAVSPGTDPDELEEQADAAADFVDELLAKMGIDAVAEPVAHGSHMYVDIVDGPDDDMSLLIGRHGQTLEAIQELMRMVVGRKLDERIRVIVDVEDYRKQRESKLEEQAKDLARRALESGKEEELEPMNSFERKLVHDAVATVPGVESLSRGEEPNRYVVIRKR